MERHAGDGKHVAVYPQADSLLRIHAPEMKNAIGVGLTAMVLAFVLVRSGRSAITELFSRDPLRCGICQIWAFTNHQSHEVRFAANGLATGWVPVTGEDNFSSVGELALAVRKGRFGLAPALHLDFPGDPAEQEGLTARDLLVEEVDALRKHVPFYIEWMER
jgi:hypothetical protein